MQDAYLNFLQRFQWCAKRSVACAFNVLLRFIVFVVISCISVSHSFVTCEMWRTHLSHFTSAKSNCVHFHELILCFKTVVNVNYKTPVDITGSNLIFFVIFLVIILLIVIRLPSLQQSLTWTPYSCHKIRKWRCVMKHHLYLFSLLKYNMYFWLHWQLVLGGWSVGDFFWAVPFYSLRRAPNSPATPTSPILHFFCIGPLLL